MAVPGSVSQAWDELRILAALVLAGRVDTGPTGRAETGGELQLAVGGNAEGLK